MAHSGTLPRGRMAHLGTLARGEMAHSGTCARRRMARSGTFARVARRADRHRLFSKLLPGHTLAGESSAAKLGSFRAGDSARCRACTVDSNIPVCLPRAELDFVA